MEKQKIIISEDLCQSLTKAIDEVHHDLLFVLCDKTTYRLCLPVVNDFECMKDACCVLSCSQNIRRRHCICHILIATGMTHMADVSRNRFLHVNR